MENRLIKVVAFVLLVVLCVSSLSLAGCGKKEGTIYESDGFCYKVFKGRVELLEYIGKGGKVTVPAELKGEPVKILCEGLFKNRSNITAIDIIA